MAWWWGSGPAPYGAFFSSCEATTSPGARRWRGGRTIASWVINDVFAVTSFVAMQNTVAAHQLHDPLHCLVTQNEPSINKQVLAPFSFIQPPPTLSEQLKASLNNIPKKGAGNSGRVNRKNQNITERLSRQSCLCGCQIQSCLQSETRNLISLRRLVKKRQKSTTAVSTPCDLNILNRIFVIVTGLSGVIFLAGARYFYSSYSMNTGGGVFIALKVDGA